MVSSPDFSDITDAQGYRYVASLRNKEEVWWRPYYGGYCVKNSPDGRTKWIGNWSTIELLLDNELNWEELD